MTGELFVRSGMGMEFVVVLGFYSLLSFPPFVELFVGRPDAVAALRLCCRGVVDELP